MDFKSLAAVTFCTWFASEELISTDVECTAIHHVWFCQKS
jgi:hypothetical protein